MSGKRRKLGVLERERRRKAQLKAAGEPDPAETSGKRIAAEAKPGRVGGHPREPLAGTGEGGDCEKD